MWGDITPYAAWHGFSGVSPLQMALKAFTEIPPDLVHSDWLSALVAEAKLIESSLNSYWQSVAKERMAKFQKNTEPPPFRSGDLVLLQKSFYERQAGLILPQADGPYMVDRILGDHTCVLSDPITGHVSFKGKPISLARLIAFEFPAQALPDLADESTNVVGPISAGMYVAVEVSVQYRLRCYVAKVIQVFETSEYLTVELHHVSDGQRFGPWKRRPWTPIPCDHIDMPDERRTLLYPTHMTEVLCIVTLNSQEVEAGRALDEVSLTRLIACGIPVGRQPGKDSTLPPRQEIH